MEIREKSIKNLGEIALRVKDLDTMQKFYEEIVGLELMKRFTDSAFFKIAEGYGGHTQLLALFDQSLQHSYIGVSYKGVSTEMSTLHHIAFAISLADFDLEKKRLEQLGLQVYTDEHTWAHYRSLYIKDPEGNEVEFVCYDESV